MAEMIPHVSQPIADKDGTVTVPWQRFFDALNEALTQAGIDSAEAIDEVLANLNFRIQSGTLSVQGLPENGIVSIDLAALADSGVGAAELERFTRDIYGRISGKQAATTANLPEGSNLYFTNERAQDAVGGALVDSASIDFTYNDVSNTITANVVAGVYQPLDADLTNIAGLADPNADRILFWDDSAGVYAYLTPGTNLTITGTTIDAAGGGGGGVSDGDKGDITVTASGATWTIDASTVTLAKMADMATASVFYRKTAGIGAPEVQTLATLKTDLGLTGTNSGDQASIVGITGTLAQFNTALTGADFATGGGTATGTNTGDQTLAGLGGQPLDQQLTDLAALSYGSNSLKVVRVNAGETGWELATISAGGGTVTSVDLANSTGLTASGGPITGSGSLTYTLSANLQAWHGLATSAKQDADAGLASIAALTTAANQSIYTTASDVYATYSLTAGGRALSAVAGTANTTPYFSAANVVTLQATTAGGRALWNNAGTVNTTPWYSAANTVSLATVSASGRALWNIAGTSGSFAYLSAADTWSLATLTAAGRAILDDADAAAQRTTLGLAVGTNVQAWDAQLDSLAGLDYTGNTLKVVRVNAAETGFELATVSGGGGSVPTGTGFTHITAGTQDAAAKLVDTADINNSQVTNAKLANMATQTIKGNSTGGAAEPSDLSLATVRSLLYAPTFIDGFILSATGTTITYSAGMAWIPTLVAGAGNVVSVAAGTITGSPGASATWHVYLKNDGTLYKSGTGPDTPYSGTARGSASGGLTTDSRYLGSFRSNASSNYYPVKFDAGQNVVNAFFLHNAGTDSALLSSGAALVATDVSAASFAPANTTLSIYVRINNTGGAGLVRYYLYNGSAFVISSNVGPSGVVAVNLPVDTTPKMQYDVTSTSAATILLLGYTFQR